MKYQAHSQGVLQQRLGRGVVAIDASPFHGFLASRLAKLRDTICSISLAEGPRKRCVTIAILAASSLAAIWHGIGIQHPQLPKEIRTGAALPTCEPQV